MKTSVRTLVLIILCALQPMTTLAFLISPRPTTTTTTTTTPALTTTTTIVSTTQLDMVGRLFRRSNTKKNKVETLEREDVDEKTLDKKKPPPQQWRVMLYSTEWQPDITARTLVKVIPALDRLAAYELVLKSREMGKVALIICRKKQAEGYCLGLQRRGLPATIELHDVER